jgi:hypothetical protein
MADATQYGGVIPFYPSKKYLEKNWAPETGITQMQVEALAHANQIARQNGLMSDKLADKMLPTLLVEEHSGINNWEYPDKPKYQNILSKAGLPTTKEDLYNSQNFSTDYDRELYKAKMMHALMAAKAEQYGDNLAIERWNGKGRSIYRGELADAENHARKVAEMEQMLQHPVNKPMVDAWETLSTRYAPGNTTTELKESPDEALNWMQEHNIPSIISDPISAATKFVTEDIPNAAHNARDAVRNWTAPSYKKGGSIDKPLKGGSKLI